MRQFGTQGRVYPEKHYVVQRAEELADFINRVKNGKYIVLFAPRQTGKTTFFRWALENLSAAEPDYFPIHLDFEDYQNVASRAFYEYLTEDIREEFETVFYKRGQVLPEALARFLENTTLTDHVTMRRFFRQLARLIPEQRVVIVIDEFDGIPPTVITDFLYALRRIYLSEVVEGFRCPFSVGITGVKSVAQLNYDGSVSPFNIQDEFSLPNFTLAQVEELLGQYTDEVGQAFAPEVIVMLHRQTGGQPFLVNRLAQILTEEMDIPKSETIGMAHFLTAHTQILEERNVNITHLITNIRRNPRFQRVLMRITSYDNGEIFNLDNEVISQLATYGVVKRGADRQCEIANPIYLYRILQAFTPMINGLEEEYYPPESGDREKDYLTDAGVINMERLLDNFRDFIARVGFRILQVPETPQEYVGQCLLFAYLDRFVRAVQGNMHLEVQTGRGRADLVIFRAGHKHIVETKIWQGQKSYQAGKQQLAAYLQSEGTTEGYYVVFDYRQTPEPRVETEQIDALTIRSYVIPVVQERPSRLS